MHAGVGLAVHQRVNGVGAVCRHVLPSTSVTCDAVSMQHILLSWLSTVAGQPLLRELQFRQQNTRQGEAVMHL